MTKLSNSSNNSKLDKRYSFYILNSLIYFNILPPDTCFKVYGERELTIFEEIKLIPLLIYNSLFQLWEDNTDPSFKYYHSIPSLKEEKLLIYFIQKKKVLGLLIMGLIMNLFNVIIPL